MGEISGEIVWIEKRTLLILALMGNFKNSHAVMNAEYMPGLIKDWPTVLNIVSKTQNDNQPVYHSTSASEVLEFFTQQSKSAQLKPFCGHWDDISMLTLNDGCKLHTYEKAVFIHFGKQNLVQKNEFINLNQSFSFDSSSEQI